MTARRPLVQLAGQVSELPVGDTLAGAEGGTFTHTQTAHGLSVGSPVYVSSPSTFALTDSDDETKLAIGLISAVPDVNTLSITQSGKVTLTTGEWDARSGQSGGLTPGGWYWTSPTLGGITPTMPTSGFPQILGQALSTTVLLLEIGDVIDAEAGSPGGSSLTVEIAQTSHGFAVGMPVYQGTSAWVQADADDETKVADALIIEVTDADNAVATLIGPVTLTTGEWDARTGDSGGLVKGEFYWLSATPGGLTKTKPTAGYQQPLGKATSTTELLFSVGPVVAPSALVTRLSDRILTRDFWEEQFVGNSSATLGAESLTTLVASSGSVQQVFSFAGGIGQYTLNTNAGNLAHAMIAVTPNANGNMMRYTVGHLFWRCRWVFLMPSQASDGTDTYTYKVGLAASLSAGTTANDVFIDYTHSVNSGKWVIRETVSSVVQTPVNTTVAPFFLSSASEVIDLTLTGTTFEFWQNGVSLGTISQNGLVSTTTMFPIFSIKKSVGTAARISYINYFAYEGEYNPMF